jgi:hypothetical protein
VEHSGLVVDPLRTQVVLRVLGQPTNSLRQIVETSLGSWGEYALGIGYPNDRVSAIRIRGRECAS